MSNSEQSEKSRGVVIFAHNTAQTDYVKIAQENARLINHFLNLPVTIISDIDTTSNSRYDVDVGTFVPWLNRTRTLAYELSPYDITLVLDADYICLDNSLNQLPLNLDFQIFRTNRFLDQATQTTTMGRYSLPLVWATAFQFTKSEFSKAIFEQVKIIEQNYAYFCSLYNIPASGYRNDFSFALALNLMSGYSPDPRTFIPWTLQTFASEVTEIKKHQQNIVVRTNTKAYVIAQQSLHFISKKFLQTPDFSNFVSEVINA